VGAGAAGLQGIYIKSLQLFTNLKQQGICLVQKIAGGINGNKLSTVIIRDLILKWS